MQIVGEVNYRMIALVAVVVACASVAHAQLLFCNYDYECSVGYFCSTTVHSCLKCLQCADLKREPPVVHSSCIKSVAECGSCLQGLMVNHRGDVDRECVVPDSSASESSLPVYIWSIIGFVILGVFIAMIIIIINVLRRKDLFRISTATWLRSSCTSLNMNASAPEPPPPYNPYTAVRAASPFGHQPDVAYSPHSEEETSHPFIKRAPGSGPASAREAAGNQNARVYDPPAYVRINPGSPNSPLSKTEDSNHWPSIHNEDTTPHDWTPSTSTNDTNGNVTISEVVETPASTASAAKSSDLPALLAAARDTTLVTPPAKKMRTQDNNNGNHGAASNDDGLVGTSSSHAPEAPSIYLNIVQINNTKL